MAVAYLRVSTDRERQELGLAAQRAAVETWAARNGVTVVAWCQDEVSGGAELEKRPGLLEAIATLAEVKAGALVFQRWDRFSRDSMTAVLAEAEVTRAGARLVSADGNGNGDDPAAKLVRAVVVAVAAFDRAMIRARIKAALAVKMSRGERTGTIPYGRRLAPCGRMLERDPVEAAIVARLAALRAEGAPLRAIVAKASEAGIVGRTGKPLGLTQVARMLRAA